MHVGRVKDGGGRIEIRDTRGRDVVAIGTHPRRADGGVELFGIDGREEARLIYQGVAHLLPQSDERRLVVERADAQSPALDAGELQDAFADIPASMRRATPPALPQVSELQAVRHYTNLSAQNMSIDTNFYPLGSCTMKYNPKRNERLANLSGLVDLHPYQPPDSLQGMLALLWELQAMLAEMDGNGDAVHVCSEVKD